MALSFKPSATDNVGKSESIERRVDIIYRK